MTAGQQPQRRPQPGDLTRELEAELTALMAAAWWRGWWSGQLTSSHMRALEADRTGHASALEAELHTRAPTSQPTWQVFLNELRATEGLDDAW